jgi:hypothetical protein
MHSALHIHRNLLASRIATSFVERLSVSTAVKAQYQQYGLPGQQLSVFFTARTSRLLSHLSLSGLGGGGGQLFPIGALVKLFPIEALVKSL